MPVNIEGLIFQQIMPDNSGAPSPFDTDLDGTATQEDEFVSVTNTNATALDISGWQIWSDSTGSGAPDAPQDGLFHTFPPGTVLPPGGSLWVINEITGSLAFAQEASEGGVESGSGAPNTNLLTEGSSGGPTESVAIVNPATGEYIVFNMSTNPSIIPGFAGFPGTTSVGEIDGHAIFPDPAAGESYQYNPVTDSYSYDDAFIPCFAEGALIATAKGDVAVQDLREGDLVLTRHRGAQPILWCGATRIDLTDPKSADWRLIEFKPGSLGPALPLMPLVVSPQHKFLMIDDVGNEVLAPAAGLVDRRFVRVKQGARSVTYYHLLLPQHAIIMANGVATESFYAGDMALAGLPMRHRLRIMAHLTREMRPAKARPFMTVGQTKAAAETALRPIGAVRQKSRSDETSQRVKA
ncbi:MAG: Hint domain-containing protein [Pseudomonadota bacterium]